MDVSQNEVLKRLKALTVVMTEEGFDGFKKAFNEFCEWLDYVKWFNVNPEDEDETREATEIALQIQKWDSEKADVLEKLTREFLRVNKISILIAHLKEKQIQYTDRKRTVIHGIEAQVLKKLWDIGYDVELGDEIYMMVEEEAHRLETASVHYQDIPVLVKLREVFLCIEHASGARNFTMVQKIESKIKELCSKG